MFHKKYLRNKLEFHYFRKFFFLKIYQIDNKIKKRFNIKRKKNDLKIFTDIDKQLYIFLKYEN